GGPAWPDRAPPLDPYVPRCLRPDPPARGTPPRLPDELHDLRPGRPDPSDEGLPGGARARPEALRPPRDPRPDLDRQEQPDRPRRVQDPCRLLLRPDRRRHVRALPASPLRLECRRLRRPAVPDRRRARTLPGGARALAEGLPLRARRRVPGHEPRAVPAAPAPGRGTQEP